jgi:hypothetical protein
MLVGVAAHQFDAPDNDITVLEELGGCMIALKVEEFHVLIFTVTQA